MSSFFQHFKLTLGRIAIGAMLGACLAIFLCSFPGIPLALKSLFAETATPIQALQIYLGRIVSPAIVLAGVFGVLGAFGVLE